MESKKIAHTLDKQARTNDIEMKSTTPFSSMRIRSEIRNGLKFCGFNYPTVLQASAISMGTVGLDLIVHSKSGTGKTVIFSTILLNKYVWILFKPQSLIVVPTREIAIQIATVLNQLGRTVPHYQAMVAIGGSDIMMDRKRLHYAKTVVGTPGRLLHLIRSNIFNLSSINMLVLDEVDKLLQGPLSTDVLSIIEALPSKRQTICCSATIDNKQIQQQLANHMRNPLLITAESKAAALVGIKQFVYTLPTYTNTAIEIFHKLNAVDYICGIVSFKQCLIFAGSQTRAETYCSNLRMAGWACAYLTGAMDQEARSDIFRLFNEGKFNVLITTDVMSRGVDLHQLDLVINLDVPNCLATYMHRIGRAGRFGTHGIAVNVLASCKDYGNFLQIMRHNNYSMHVLRFPLQRTDTSLAETSRFWNFDSHEEDIKYFGLFDIVNFSVASLLKSSDDDTITNNNQHSTDLNISTFFAKHITPNINANLMTLIAHHEDDDDDICNIDDDDQEEDDEQEEEEEDDDDNVDDDVEGEEEKKKKKEDEEEKKEDEDDDDDDDEEVAHLPSSNTIDDASSILADESEHSEQTKDEKHLKLDIEHVEPSLRDSLFDTEEDHHQIIDFFAEYRQFTASADLI